MAGAFVSGTAAGRLREAHGVWRVRRRPGETQPGGGPPKLLERPAGYRVSDTPSEAARRGDWKMGWLNGTEPTGRIVQPIVTCGAEGPKFLLRTSTWPGRVRNSAARAPVSGDAPAADGMNRQDCGVDIYGSHGIPMVLEVPTATFLYFGWAHQLSHPCVNSDS